MAAIKDTQNLRDCGLHAKGKAGEASLGEAFKRGLVHAFRVRFYGNLCAGGDPKILAHSHKETFKDIGGQERGGSAAKEDARGGASGHTSLAENTCSHAHFCKGALVVALSVSSGAKTNGIGIEITVAATNLAEGNMHIDGEGALCIRFGKFSSETTAFFPGLAFWLVRAH